MRIFKYGKMTPIQHIWNGSTQDSKSRSIRTSTHAIREKVKLLREFGIISDENEAAMIDEMKKALAESPDLDFDRVLDKFARKLISEKLGG